MIFSFFFTGRFSASAFTLKLKGGREGLFEGCFLIWMILIDKTSQSGMREITFRGKGSVTAKFSGFFKKLGSGMGFQMGMMGMPFGEPFADFGECMAHHLPSSSSIDTSLQYYWKQE